MNLINTPSFLKSALSGSRALTLTYNDVKDTNIASTSSFMYDAVGGLKSTQQLNVDWSQFQNHTFFMSAEAKVNLAFEQIINGYPFDGTRLELEQFFEKLTGFEKWVYDQFPKFKGQLHFNNSYISVTDAQGALFPEIAKKSSGQGILTPSIDQSLTIELHLSLPQQSNDTQFVCQKISDSSQGFALYLLPSTSSLTCDVAFSVVSGSVSLTTSTTIDKGKFNHIAATLNRDEGVHHLQMFKSGELVASSKNKTMIGELNIKSSKFILGSGSLMSLQTPVSATLTLSGTIDEFRLFHSTRTPAQLQQYARKQLFANDDLKLYYKFNEPPPPLTSIAADAVNSIVIDSSGNALHALITNFTSDLRQDASADTTSRMVYELLDTSPILFPAHAEVIDLNINLITSATLYDSINPNLITKLIPQHYLLDGATLEGRLSSDVSSPYGGSGMPGQGDKNSVQLLLTFLYIYAKFFDELKLFVDSFSTLKYVNYDETDTIPDALLNSLIKDSGFNLPPLFNNSTLEQYIRAENIEQDLSVSLLSLKHVQNQLLRRVLINMPDIIRSKGTQHSIKSFLRSVGIDPDNSIRIREYGGPTSRTITSARENKNDTGAMVKFISSSFAISPFLSSSRIEPGKPDIRGTFVNGISNQRSDGLLTSGSWTVELIAKWNPSELINSDIGYHSLVRMAVTGSSQNSERVIANLLAVSSSIEPKVMLYVKPGTSINSPTLALELPTPVNNGIFNGDKWNISFGCIRNDEINSRVSSSYFLRVANQNASEITWNNSTSSFFDELGSSGGKNIFRDVDTTLNVSGAFLIIGEGRPMITSASSPFLNDTSGIAESQIVSLRSKISNLRFWSKTVSPVEWTEHVKSHKSLGASDPYTNYNFVTNKSGSFQRLRLDSLQKQEQRNTSGSGNITFLDFSLNNMHLTGHSFHESDDVIVGELFSYSYLSPYYDEGTSNDKVRIRGLFDNQNEPYYVNIAPTYEILKSEEPTDDVRLSIEFSLLDSLNRDIVNMFSTFDAIDNAIGSPELVFSSDYPDLERLRNIYFNRLKEKLNFRAFFEFYRWFDSSIGTFIEQLIPRKTNFKGTNFVIESHMLERHKLEYQGNELYLADEDRSRINSVLLLQQIVGTLRKY